MKARPRQVGQEGEGLVGPDIWDSAVLGKPESVPAIRLTIDRSIDGGQNKRCVRSAAELVGCCTLCDDVGIAEVRSISALLGAEVRSQGKPVVRHV